MDNGSGDQAQETVELSLQLQMDGVSRPVTLRAPTRPMRPVDLLPVVQAFDDEVVALAEEASRRAGNSVSCKAGCGACCRQLVPLSETEARFLSQVMAAMPRKRRRVIERRFEKAVSALRRAGLLDRLRDAWRPENAAEREQLGLDYFRLGIACPFLENESCGIHPDRPLACREFLVTSPAVNCSNPAPENIAVVPLPGKPSKVLYSFGDGEGNAPYHWFPLTLAVDWFQRTGAEEPPSRPGHLMLMSLLKKMQPEQPG